MESINKSFIEKLLSISASLEEGKAFISQDDIINFQDSAAALQGDIKAISEEGRCLRLGIVGEVKAGKSSFLNALLFNGRDILPKAPTPMTAALTKINYSETPHAKIVFYSKNDWEIICTRANQYDMELNSKYERYCKEEEERQKKAQKQKNATFSNSYAQMKTPQSSNQEKRSLLTIEDFERRYKSSLSQELLACKEVLELAMKSGVDINRNLNEELEIPLSSDGSYFTELNKYVGAGGMYTPIVKYTEISLNDKMLEGIEVIDTPGLNDPILSRSRVTNKFLGQCNAVFLVSYCGQFLGSDDMNFILNSMPNEGIKKAVLIGSKLDSAILQYPTRGNLRPSFKESYIGTVRNCEAQAIESLAKCRITDNNVSLITRLKESLPPNCVSAIAYTASQKLTCGERLSDAERQMLELFKTRYQDFSEDQLLGLSSIPDITEKVFIPVREDKERIISERIADILNARRIALLGLLESIYAETLNYRNDVCTADVERLKREFEQARISIDSARIGIKDMFEKEANKVKWDITDLTTNMSKELANNSTISVVSNTETKHHSHTSGHLWWKKTEHWDEHITTHTANINDARINLQKYFNWCFENINNLFRQITNVEKFRKDIVNLLNDALDTSGGEFDAGRIMGLVNRAIQRVSPPQIDMDIDNYYEELESLVSSISSNGVVKNEKIPVLQSAQDKVKNKMFKDMVDEVRKEGTEYALTLTERGAEFVDNIQNSMNSTFQSLEKSISNKEESLKKLESFLLIVTQAKKELSK